MEVQTQMHTHTPLFSSKKTALHDPTWESNLQGAAREWMGGEGGQSQRNKAL